MNMIGFDFHRLGTHARPSSPVLVRPNLYSSRTGNGNDFSVAQAFTPGGMKKWQFQKPH
jgi:hypothetical protein